MASGHASSCDKATIGSVCYCACAGVRHSVAITGGLPRAGGVGIPRQAAVAQRAADQPAPEADRASSAPVVQPETPGPEVQPVGQSVPTPEPERPSVVPEQDGEPTERIRKAYAELAANTGSEYVSFASVRDAAGLNQEEFEAAVRQLRRDDDVNLAPESDQRNLTAEQRAAAVVIGNQPNHLIQIDAPSRNSGHESPTPPGGGSTRPGIAAMIDRGAPTIAEPDDERRGPAMADFGAAMNGTYAGLEVEARGMDPMNGEAADGTELRGVLGRGVIRDENGEEVGAVERGFYRDENGDLVAVHSFLQLDPSVQGRGFAREFNGALTEWYREQGVSRIELDANIDVGGYAWSTQGFDFADERAAGRVANRLEQQVDSPDADPEQAAAGRAVLDRMRNTPFGSPDYPTAYEVSQIGRTPGAQTWLGREAMLGSYWAGVRWL